MSVEAREHRFTVDEFHRMAQTWILSPDDRLELLDGRIVEMTPTHPPHASTVKRLAKRPEDLHFLVEVADTSTERDRREKLPRYAAAGVREVWLVDLPRTRIEVHREPSADGYTHVETVSSGAVSPLALPDVAVLLDEILG